MHPSTERRRRRAAGEPPLPLGRPKGSAPRRDNLTVRLEPSLRSALDAAAQAAGVTLTAYVVAALEAALGRTSADRDPSG
jgi:hypothetical protein